ncbi:methylated-DNA--[protein]-cysteine S-methyltransferase [Permianibacter sp. IMCC34836]|uniref:bifunctional transcriptional activator/DNA repair enzyme AdaA n=1 Tax=Permianibacter fluminis TaxID=2738515 RepID=UPI0015571CC3|nr:methylated-DNA--[protein]-cysteine S-methyltransferase [Permianibacter fluminis]NQD35922.1 methylated-DNA--[protein]-cysteine S-methyltransferase [Permianibacter fluminis]
MTTAQLKPREMAKAFYDQNADYDGLFFVGVKTTGIFCRPSCSARRPKPENVSYFHDADTAAQAGFRACKRCHPLNADGRPPTWVQTLLKALEQSADGRLPDERMRELGVDPARARRYFRQHHGMTFQAWARSRRLNEARETIRSGEQASKAIRGYSSESGFRSAFDRAFGHAPGASAKQASIITAQIESPVGPLLAGVTDDGVCLLEFVMQKRHTRQLEAICKWLQCKAVPGEHKWLKALRKQLAEYFAGSRQQFDLPLIYPGTSFQQSVWQQLQGIPYGETISYQELARRVGDENASRAVGTANGCNRLAIIIPCHRVVNKSGNLGGYGGGLHRKSWLLKLERGEL